MSKIVSEGSTEESFFDEKKPTVYTEDPFSYNFVAKKQSKVKEMPTPQASQIVATPFYNRIGKALGVVEPKDWDSNHDKIFVISEWAKERSGLEDVAGVIGWIDDVVNSTASIGKNRIDDLYAKIMIENKNG